MKSSLIIIFAGLLSIVLGCSTMEGPELVLLNPPEIASQIIVNSDFVMMQIGDTHSLEAEVMAIDKSNITIDANKITWLSQDTSQLEVDRYGKLKAKVANRLPIKVIVSYKENLNTVRDTVQVYITSGRVDGSMIKLVLLDSNRIGASPSAFGLKYPRVRVDIFDGSGNLVTKGAQIPILTPAPVSNVFNPTGGDEKEPVYEIMNDLSLIGSFWVKSSVNLYGKAVIDSVEFVGIYPVTSSYLAWNIIFEQDGFVVPRIQDTTERAPQIQPCGVFSIMNLNLKPFDVVFSDSTSVGTCDELPASVTGKKIVGGNILNLARLEQGIRRVRTTGVVNYYLRDAVTKERLPVSGRYESVEAPN